MRFDRPYCLFKSHGRAYYATGTISQHHLLADVPRPRSLPVISMLPYTQLRERGYVLHDGNEPIISLVSDVCDEIDVDAVTLGSPPVHVELAGPPEFDLSDEEFEERVAQIIAREIRRGEGSNFLLSRKSRVRIRDFSSAVANEIFRRLVKNEFGAYLTFCFFDGERYFIGSSPERHISAENGTVRMNPICGTLPKAALHSRADMVEFLTDSKEIHELFQVVDEELKIMSRLCNSGGNIFGPYLKEMSSLFHTEYVLEGTSSIDNVDILRQSMYAATMIGSPLENAARIVHKYEDSSRRYYSSAIALFGLDGSGREYLDSAITIRTMEIQADGHALLQSGASIVRDSIPAKECLEIKAKTAGLLRAIATSQTSSPILQDYLDADLEATFQARNQHLSVFWLETQKHSYLEPALEDRSILIIDNEDEFTQMLAHVLRHLGLRTTVVNWDDPALDVRQGELVLLGPGPGDPRNLEDPKIKKVHDVARSLLESGSRFLAVCLGHQVLSHILGFELEAVDPPLQGVQKVVDLFGRRESVGFYNTFFARLKPGVAQGVEVASEPNGLITALRARRFYSIQFHAESVLTTNTIPIIRDALLWITRAS